MTNDGNKHKHEEYKNLLSSMKINRTRDRRSSTDILWPSLISMMARGVEYPSSCTKKEWAQLVEKAKSNNKTYCLKDDDGELFIGIHEKIEREKSAYLAAVAVQRAIDLIWLRSYSRELRASALIVSDITNADSWKNARRERVDYSWFDSSVVDQDLLGAKITNESFLMLGIIIRKIQLFPCRQLTPFPIKSAAIGIEFNREDCEFVFQKIISGDNLIASSARRQSKLGPAIQDAYKLLTSRGEIRPELSAKARDLQINKELKGRGFSGADSKTIRKALKLQFP
jgi:hypothetical protein